MNKTISLNLSGTVFHAEESAYEKLSAYLRKIRETFLNQPGGDEIVIDIEARLAELFSEKLSAENRQAITDADVEQVLREMGNPDEFETEDEKQGKTESTHTPSGYRTGRRLFRDPDDRVLGGVCSGISAYVGQDPVWLRLLFAVLFFSFGTGVLIYVVLWMILPTAKTTAEKLQMRGESVNLDNISRFIKDEAQAIREKNYKADGLKGFLNRTADVLVEVLKACIRLISTVFAVFAVFISGILILSLLVLSIAVILGSGIKADNPFVFLLSQGQMIISMVGILLLAGIPLFWLMNKSLAFLFHFPALGLRAGYALLVLWIAGFGLTVYAASDITSEFSRSATHRQVEKLNDPTRNFYLITAGPGYAKETRVRFGNAGYGWHINTEGMEGLHSGEVKLTVVKSTSGKTELIRVVSSRGSSETFAKQLAMGTRLNIVQKDSMLVIPSWFEITGDKWRNQSVELILRVPPGTTLELSPSLYEILDEDAGISWDDETLGKVCEMRDEGLHCVDCPSRENGVAGEFRSLNHADFDAIEAGGEIQVAVKPGNYYDIRIYGTDQNKVKARVRNGILVLSHEDKLSKDTRITIELPELNKVYASGAAQFDIRGFGVGDLYIEGTGASRIRFDGNLDELEADMSGASELRILGKGKKFALEGSGATHIYADDYVVEEAEVNLSGASEANMHVSMELDAEASGAAILNYSGKPIVVNKEKSGAARISGR